MAIIDTDNIDLNLTVLEKQALAFTLFKSLVGPIPAPDESRVLILPFEQRDVPSEATATVQTLCHAEFVPARLIILEPTIEIVEVGEYQVGEVVTRGPWWNRWTKKTPISSSRHHKRLITVPRSAFSIQGAFIGNRGQFTTHQGAIGGDAFGPAGALTFDDKMCAANTFITLQVRNHLKEPVPFLAVAIGREPSAKLRAA